MVNVLGSESKTAEISSGSYKYYDWQELFWFVNLYIARNIRANLQILTVGLKSWSTSQRKLMAFFTVTPISKNTLSSDYIPLFSCKILLQNKLLRYRVEAHLVPDLCIVPEKNALAGPNLVCFWSLFQAVYARLIDWLWMLVTTFFYQGPVLNSSCLQDCIRTKFWESDSVD